MFRFYSIPNKNTISKILGECLSLKFTSPKEMNDKDEFKFQLKVDNDVKLLKDRFFLDNPNKSEEEFYDWRNNLFPNGIWWQQCSIRANMNGLISFCSFSKNYKNSTMWSHYSNCH